MLERRLRHNVVLLLLTFVIGLGLYEIIAGPGPPAVTITNVLPSEQQAYTPITNSSNLYTYPITSLVQDDYTRLINLRGFKFVLISDVCSNLNDSSVLLVVLIHSAPKNYVKRKTIRETWGTYNPLQMRLVFMIGAVTDSALQAKLIGESDRFKDITQGNFIDTYRNITYKHVMVFKYATYHCPQARYILKTDDDVFVNIPNVVEHLNNISSYGASGLLMCWLRQNENAVRSYRSKWRVSFDEYPDKRYPPYCPGWAVLYSQDVLFRLYRAAQNTSYFWIDDVFITGVLFREIGGRHTDINDYMLSKSDQNEIVYKNPSYHLEQGFLFSRPNLNETEIRRLFNYTLMYNLRYNVHLVKA